MDLSNEAMEVMDWITNQRFTIPSNYITPTETDMLIQSKYMMSPMIADNGHKVYIVDFQTFEKKPRAKKRVRTKTKRNRAKYRAKTLTKNKCKKQFKTRFKIGRYYFLRIKPKDGSADVVIKYLCKKTVYSVNDIPMNIVIMKQITPFEGRKFTLDKHECEKFHIKFEPGLEVWPMAMNWIPEKKQNTI